MEPMAEETHSAPLTIQADDWRALKSVFDTLSGYLYRGEADTRWKLQSTLERGLPPWQDYGARLGAERLLLETFSRRAHHYVVSPPRHNFRLEWMALLRHYGGPSRLLDVTRSPYVAAFFALDTANHSGNAGIWAIREVAVNAGAAHQLAERQNEAGFQLTDVTAAEHVVESLLDKVDYNLIVSVEPQRLNERMSIQQGTFLIPLSLRFSLFEQLIATLGLAMGFNKQVIRWGEFLEEDALHKSDLIKIEFPTSIREDALRDLRLMNVTAATLYPGLEGFAQSLRTRLSIADLD